jgi:hypothetical protein
LPKRIENPTSKQLAARIARQKRHAVNPGKHSQAVRRWQRKNPEKVKEIKLRHRKNNPEAVKRSYRKVRLKLKFGITLERFDQMLRSQGFACAICGNGKSGGRGLWHVDHCHQTKRIRGLLCHNCNTALGLFKENPVIIRSAMTYLKKAR